MRQHAQHDLDRFVVLEIDGPGVSPEVLEAPSILELAAAFFQLLKANAQDSAERLSLTHVQIVDKCAAVVALPDSLDLAKTCAGEAVQQIAGGDPPRGGAALVQRIRNAIQNMPADHTAKVMVGQWHRDVVAPDDPTPEPLDSILSIRAVPIRIGGRRPAVRFRSDLEDDFTLETNHEVARAIGAYLYTEVDIEARVHRAADGTIADGRLNSFQPLDVGDPISAWREWFRSVGGDEWSDEERTGTEQ